MLKLDVVHNLETPCFVFEEPELKKNFIDFRDALFRHWGANSYVCYSVKTNPFPWVVRTALKCGCLAEVVSDNEYSLALDCGCDPSNIVFNGPIKSPDWLVFALKTGAIVNLDSELDLEVVRNYAQLGNQAKIGLRVNIDLEAYCPGETVTGDAGGRFGWSYEGRDLERVINTLNAIPGVAIAGLHMHVTTRSRSQNVYRVLSEFAARIVLEYGLNPEYIDIGGGFFGGGPENNGAYDAYAHTIASQLKGVVDPVKCALFVEPGGAVVCTPGYYVGRVRDIKNTPRDRFVVTDFSRINIDHEMKKTSYSLTAFASGKATLRRQVLCGFTCMESDRLCVLEDAVELKRGDYIVICFAGAYSMSFTPEFFIWGPPAVYSKNGGVLHLERASTCPSPPALYV